MEEISLDSKLQKAAEYVANTITKQFMDRNNDRPRDAVTSEKFLKYSLVEEEVMKLTTVRLIQAAEVVACDMTKQLFESSHNSIN